MPNLNPSRKPQPGDMIQIFRSAYEHWALYIGDGKIIHITSDGPVLGIFNSEPIAEIKKERLEEVAEGDDWQVNNSNRKLNSDEIKEIIKNAEKRVGEKVHYNLLTNNCEHFVNELLYGKAVSKQVRWGLALLLVTGAIVGAFNPVAGVAVAAAGAATTFVSMKAGRRFSKRRRR